MLWTTITTLALAAAGLASPLVAERQTNSSHSAGCGKKATLKSGDQATVTINGKARQWILRIPDNYDSSKPHRLVLGLHWLNGHYTDVDSNQFYGLRPLSNGTAIFVAPNGLNSGWANPNGDDVTFIKTLISKVEDDLCIDSNLRYATGWSYGGAMSYSLACSLGSQIRAVGVLSGAQLSGCAGGGTAPVAYYGQHGVSDTVLPISSGKALRDHYVQVNGCKAQTTTDPKAGSKMHIKVEYQGCSAGHPVTWIAFDGPHEPLPKEGKATSFTPQELYNFFWQFS